VTPAPARVARTYSSASSAITSFQRSLGIIMPAARAHLARSDESNTSSM
jgi:hypothetical protein